MDYQNCRLCPRQCGVDRTAGETGFCGCPAGALVAKTMLHKWEEPALAGNGGSGAVFFGGCTLGCSYCQNAAISRLRQRREVPLEEAAAVAEEDFFALLCAKDDIEELLAAMAQLPSMYRDALYYRYVMELPLSEAAQLLGVKSETLRKQTSRARDLLAKKLREKGWGANGRQ